MPPPPLPPRPRQTPSPPLATPKEQQRATQDRLIRRFNKAVRHVERGTPPGTGSSAGGTQLSCGTSEREKLSAEALRSNVERTRLIWAAVAQWGRPIARLRSWEDPLRTGSLGFAYATAWYSNRLLLLILAFLVLALASPSQFRHIVPQAPEGRLSSPVVVDTGESEATEFSGELAAVAASSIEEEENSFSAAPLEGPAKPGAGAKILPIQKGLGAMCDGWERWANAFKRPSTRLRIAVFVLPPALVTVLATPTVVKILGLALGSIFFGGPAIDAVDKRFGTSWRDMDIRTSLLLNVPTNVEHTYFLLRRAEEVYSPLPPPLPLIKTLDAAMTSTAGLSPRQEIKTSASGAGKLASFIRNASKGLESGAGVLSGQQKIDWQLALDKLASSTGKSVPAAVRSVIPTASQDSNSSSRFYAHFQTRPGHLLVESIAGEWRVRFVAIGAAAGTPFELRIAEMSGVKKLSALGWKGRAAAGWLFESESVGTGLELRGAGSEVWLFSMVLRRDELFNRLIAVDEAHWESI